LHNRPANGKQGPIPEEMFQTLLTNQKQGNSLSQRKLAFTALNTLFAL
jgi:hypothetical protein